MKIFILFALALSTFGCASATHQADRLLLSPPEGLLRTSEVRGVPFIDQKVGLCGPATLAMVMQWNGKTISVNELAKQVYTPGSKGSYQTDMISASRRNSMMAVPIAGLADLFREIAAGHPVIVFENLALTWVPQYHYAVVYGYDLDKEIVLMHSGSEKNKRWDIRKFERSWKLVDYWGLVVLPPGQLAVTAGELANVTAAAALEQLGQLDEASVTYEAIIKRWPDSLGALIGLGNISYSKKEYKKSVAFLKQAVKAHPESKHAKNNLIVAEKALQD